MKQIDTYYPTANLDQIVSTETLTAKLQAALMRNRKLQKELDELKDMMYPNFTKKEFKKFDSVKLPRQLQWGKETEA